MFEAEMSSATSVELPQLLPRNPELGSVTEQNYYQDVYFQLKEAIDKNPGDYRKRLKVAQLFMLEARITGEHGYYYPAALTVINQILDEEPAEDVIFGAVSLKASVYLSLHKFQEAKELAEYAIKLNGYNAVIYGSLVDANVELGNYEEAVNMSDKMVSIRPDLRSYSRISYLREIHGDLPGAIEAMQMAIKAGAPGYEETAWCSLILGELYEQTDEWENAGQIYQAILENRPNYPFAIAALARVDRHNKNFEAAENRLKQAIHIIPEVSFYVDLASLYQETGRDAEKQKLIPEILEMLEDDEANGHRMGMEYAHVYLDLIQDYEKAYEYAKTEYDLRPENIEVNQLMAEVYLKQNNLSQANTHLEKALRTKSRNPELQELATFIRAQADNHLVK
ncbi:MAG: tetratricopeptide repeat protein [Bacteroidetes bacterium]|nr:tetratricopeptide repeat protein [Bacteroidota bacterium]